jgi:hypothetical protein
MSALGPKAMSPDMRSTHNAFENPISRGKKKLEQASITTPRRAKTKPILAVADTTRMAMGKVMVIPIYTLSFSPPNIDILEATREKLTPTAEPWMAAMTGFLHLWIANVRRPPLHSNSISKA